MKKLFLMVLTILASGSAFALPVGNSSDASLLCDGLMSEGHCGDPYDPCLRWYNALSIRFGFYGDYVFNRHMEVRGSNDPDIEHTEIFTNAAYLTANFWDRYDIFTTLGATNFYIDTNTSAFNIGLNGQRIEIETASSFSWSIGGRARIWECGCTTLGIEAQYFHVSPHVKRVTTAASVSVYPDDAHIKYHEWQAGIGVSHRISIFIPYVALKWSLSRMNFHDASFASPPVSLENLKSKKHWGYAMGISLVDCEKASLTVEGRFGDEKAIHVNGQIRF